jgi:protein O-mannosyl-transferase
MPRHAESADRSAKQMVFDAGRRKSLSASRISRLVAWILLLGVILWTFWSSLRNPFHFDDNLFLQSPQVTDPGDPWYLLKPTQTRQLTYLTFYWNYRIGGTSPAGYHAVNLLLHLLNVLAIYWFVRLLMRRYPQPQAGLMHSCLPLVAAGIFALHPVQTEAVNYVYQRSVILAALFVLLSMSSYLQARHSPHRKIWLTVCGASFLLAVASKESALILPVICAALVWADSSDFRAFRQRLMSSYWFAAIAAAAGIGVVWILYLRWRQGEATAGLALAQDAFRYLRAQFQVLASYLRLLIIPTGLSIDHDFRPSPFFSLYSFACMALLVGILLFAAWVRRRNPMLALLVAAFLIFLMPTSSIVPSSDLLFEHRLYLPMIAAATLMAWSILAVIYSFLATGKRQMTVTWIGMCLLLGGYSALSKNRTYVWGDSVRLWKDAVAKAPRKTRAHYNLGAAYLERDRAQARLEWLETIRLDAQHAAALYNLGWLAQTDEAYDTARNYYREAIRADSKTWQAYHSLGNIDVLQGNLENAKREFTETIHYRKDYWPAYLNLAAVQMQTGDIPSALQTLENLKKFRWDLLEVRYLSAYALVQAVRFAEAENELKFIAERDPAGAYRNRIADLRSLIRARGKTSR